VTDSQFLAALEACTLAPAQFTHRMHVRAGYLYLQQMDFPQALAHLCTVLKRYAAALGQSERYHETITVAFLALINERLCDSGEGAGWETFADAHPELLRRDALRAFYPAEVLESPRARRMFILGSPAGAGRS
jgi:hypothetical protein